MLGKAKHLGQRGECGGEAGGEGGLAERVPAPPPHLPAQLGAVAELLGLVDQLAAIPADPHHVRQAGG